jgi:NAD(P)-dependent dehydrogenase (short-subunit alcohol dehydrogenase family)
MENKLEGKIAVITGGGSGIGLATAKRFVSEEAYVFIIDLHKKELDSALSEISSKNVVGIEGDVSNTGDLDKLYNTVREHKGHLDILFANAGIIRFARLGEISEKHFYNLIDINVKGILFTVQHALPIFEDGGSIILNASIGASKATEGLSVYSATKAAIRSFARTWTVELNHRRIRVNTVSPGSIDTPIMNPVMSEEEYEQFKNNVMKTIPMGRMGSPDEVAKAVSFLASDDASYITGIELFVDGGVAQI